MQMYKIYTNLTIPIFFISLSKFKIARKRYYLFAKWQIKITFNIIRFFCYTAWAKIQYKDNVLFRKCFFPFSITFDNDYKHFAGYELKNGIFFTVGFHKRLFNIAKIHPYYAEDFDKAGGKLKNKTGSLSVGYKF